MKRILIFSMIAASIGFSAIGVEGSSNTANATNNAFTAPSAQIDRILRNVTKRQRRFRNNRNNNRVSYETRTVWKGRKEYRDTYRITWKNGVRHEKRVERVRIR